MRTQPNQYIIYWTSQFSGNNPGHTTEVFKANMLVFKDLDKAHEFHAKLTNLQKDGATYRGRIVHHVGAFND